jgi:branched-chain amino acid transport system ATP-binding protein
MSLLSINNITVKFEGLTAVNNVSLNINKGEIVSIIGPNGAGKTTLFNTITGVYLPTKGDIKLNGKVTYKIINLKTIIIFLLSTLICSIGLFLAINLQGLWSETINSSYIYQQEFDWTTSFKKGIFYLYNLATIQVIIPFIIGGFIGFYGSFSLWNSSRRTPNVVASLGVSRTFQNIRLFKSMSVIENVLVGMDNSLKSSLFKIIFSFSSSTKELNQSIFDANKILESVELIDFSNQKASSLSYGLQRRLEIARAIATNPKIILLDEPAAGMNPTETSELMNLILKIRENGITVLLIEHHMKVVMGVSDKIIVLNYGNKIAEGTPIEIRNNKDVIEAYLGKDDIHA